MTDIFGYEIKPGAFIAYGHAVGRGANLRIGRVRKVVEGTKRDGPRHMDHVVVVRGVNQDWGQTPKLNSLDGRVQHPHARVLVLDRMAVPQLIQELLGGVGCDQPDSVYRS